MAVEKMALMIPILALMIPIVAVVMGMINEMQKTRLKHMAAAGASEIETLKKRIAEMEQRVLTLQDIVLATDYEARRKLDATTREDRPFTSEGTIRSRMESRDG